MKLYYRLLALGSQVELTPHSKVLEIGPSCAPLLDFVSDLGVDYIDYMSQGELDAFAKARGRRVKAPYIKYVTGDYREYAQLIDVKYDVIVANHLFEHIYNPLGFLNSLAELLTPKGVIFFTIPDKRYTVDYLRSFSSLPQLLDIFNQDKQVLSVDEILDELSNSRPGLNWKDVYNGSFVEKLNKPRTDDQIAKMLKERLELGSSWYGHAHVYSAYSFFTLFSLASCNSIFDWELKHFIDIAPYSNEFYAFFGLKSEGDNSDLERKSLSDFQEFSLEFVKNIENLALGFLTESLSCESYYHEMGRRIIQAFDASVAEAKLLDLLNLVPNSPILSFYLRQVCHIQ